MGLPCLMDSYYVPPLYLPPNCIVPLAFRFAFNIEGPFCTVVDVLSRTTYLPHSLLIPFVLECAGKYKINMN